MYYLRDLPSWITESFEMSKSILLMLCLVTGLLVLACGKTEEANHNTAATNTSTAAASPAAHANDTPATASAGDKIGIEECDNFMAAYDNCVSTKVPEAARAQYKTALATWRTEWKKLADNPQTKGTLAGICKTNLENARTQFKTFGCTF